MSGDKVVVVTGASGEIGRALAMRFARDGVRLALLDRTIAEAEQAAQAVGDSKPAALLVAAADQTDRASVEKAFEQIRDSYGRVDVLVANAGFARFAPFLDMSPKTWDLHVDVNLSGTFHVCQLGAREMVAGRRGGVIIVISSCLALFHSDQVGAYSATKAALLMMVRTMAAELGVHRIRANAVLPGVVESSMTREMLQRADVREQLLRETPIGRLATPADIAFAAAFLASAEAECITGASLLVDGGQSIYNQPSWYRQDRSSEHDPLWVPRWGVS